MLEPVWYEALPDNFWYWYEQVKADASEIISLTIRVKRGQISLDYLDIYGKPKRAKLILARPTHLQPTRPIHDSNC